MKQTKHAQRFRGALRPLEAGALVLLFGAATPSAGAAESLQEVTTRPAAATDAAATTDAGAASPPVSEPVGFWDSLRDALFGGSVALNLRLRAEIVEQADLDTAQAYTERLRLGYGTKPFHGFSFYAELEDIRSADYDLYNAAGQNGEPDKAVVADPEDTELNQFYARYSSEYVTAIAGRQRIILDDHRFVGNVGWRQNEQTFDAYTLSSSRVPDTELFYSYVDDVNRVFGPRSGNDFRSDSHLLNASYSGLPLGKLTAFAYFLDLRNSPANSSQSFGARLAGKQGVDTDLGELLLTYTASYAYQVDGGDNPNHYDVHYYFVEGGAGLGGVGSVGVGYEVLGSDDGDFAFRTPLATLHKFNGWADVFLTTPNDGLEDLYFRLSADLPFGVKSSAFYHLFFSDHGGSDYGGEFDAVVTKALSKEITLLAKAAVFHGKSDTVPSNVQKYWLEMEVAF